MTSQPPATIANGTAIETAIETADGRSGVVDSYIDTIAGIRYYRIAFGRERQALPETDFMVPELETPWHESCGAETVRRVVTELESKSRMRDKDPSPHQFVGHN